ncbi:hypothetical protein [Nocardia sp. NBC_01329]|uniref:hypothetical protein n=1 Tax=Nocardia sp. NBC_01329 TaxID=2903594 RepID=UPI002E102D8A|nr:hypothetical protein OG405_02785 [Nocardia sp. NBC_01329]
MNDHSDDLKFTVPDAIQVFHRKDGSIGLMEVYAYLDGEADVAVLESYGAGSW